MSRKQKIEQDVEKTLSCFDHIEHLQPNPWFLTRLQARVRSIEGQTPRPALSLFGLSIVRPAIFALIVVLNVLTVLLVFQRQGDLIEYRSELVSRVAAEYAYAPTDETLSVDSI